MAHAGNGGWTSLKIQHKTPWQRIPSFRKQLEKLTKDLIAGPEKCGYGQSAWSTVMVTDHIWKKFKVKYVPRSVQNLLKRLGFTIQKSPQYPPKAASKSEPERFRKKLGAYWHKERHTK